MKSGLVPVAVVVLAIGGAVMLRSLFPKTVPGPPRIVTQYDTVQVLKTNWVTKLKRDTLTITVVEQVTVTVPETVFVVAALRGITALSVGSTLGDSTMVTGFSLAPLDSGYERRAWQSRIYTLGPLKTMFLDDSTGVPRVTFYPQPGKPCGQWCKVGHYLLGGSVGAGAAALACTISR